MTAKRLVNHNGRTTGVVEDTIEAIKASDLLLLMDVVRDATGLFNELERARNAGGLNDTVWNAWTELGAALRALGLIEVT